jgi:predicted PurR-regulated permease PerM
MALERRNLYPTRHEFTVRVILAVGIIMSFFAMLFLAWYLVEVLLLVFGGILLSILLRSAASPISQYTRLPMPGGIVVVLLLMLGMGTLFIWYVGPVLAEQTNRLVEELPATTEQLKEGFLRTIPLPKGAITSVYGLDWGQIAGSVLKRVVSIVTLSFGVIANILIILFVGVYLAFSPGPYVRGIVRLVPVSRRETAQAIFDRLGSVLRWWLVGQLASMTFVGTLVAIGIGIIGISPALVLGIAAGILEFIPYIGPTLGFMPILILAIPLGFKTVLYVLGLYLLVQSLESYIITPLVQRKAVELPPVLTVMAQVVLALLVGFLGLLFATPLIACTMVLIDMIYVKAILEGKEVLPEESARNGA